MDISFNIVGKGTPIIFIHGIGSRKYSWNGVIEELKDQYQCISYDLRGHGESKFDKSEFTLEDLVDDIEKLRSHLNIQKAHLVGHSLGGMIGPSYTRKYQDKVNSVTLLSTAAFRRVEDKEQILSIINRINNEGLDKVLPTLSNRWFTDIFIRNNKNIINKRLKQVQETPIKVFLNVFQIYALTEMGPWLNQITIPSLVMTGQNDIGCNPKINKKIAMTLKNSQLEILSDLKHAITLEAPKLVGSKIKKFLNGLKN